MWHSASRLLLYSNWPECCNHTGHCSRLAKGDNSPCNSHPLLFKTMIAVVTHVIATTPSVLEFESLRVHGAARKFLMPSLGWRELRCRRNETPRTRRLKQKQLLLSQWWGGNREAAKVEHTWPALFLDLVRFELGTCLTGGEPYKGGGTRACAPTVETETPLIVLALTSLIFSTFHIKIRINLFFRF